VASGTIDTFASPDARAMHETPAVNPDSIRASIAAALACEELRVRGDGHHFEALIVCAAFEGKSRVARHQLVYAALGDRMREEIHALSMLTMTPAEFVAARAQSQQ
jgi:acid stress-induced BolA-like protein IbaG/YrbA